jgi:hypothetical protein
MNDTERLFDELLGPEPSHRVFSDANLDRVKTLCGMIQHRESCDVPNRDSWISPRAAWDVRQEGASCVAQSTFLASMMGCLRDSKTGRPPATCLMSFQSITPDVPGHSVVAVSVNRALITLHHESDDSAILFMAKRLNPLAAETQTPTSEIASCRSSTRQRKTLMLAETCHR